MERIGIFETQRNSDWVQTMLQQNNFGHRDVVWRRRALMAIPTAGIEGQTLTTLEIEECLTPLIGPAPTKPERSMMAAAGCSLGVLRKTGTMRRPEGTHNLCAEYEIVGHLDENQEPVLMGEIK